MHFHCKQSWPQALRGAPQQSSRAAGVTSDSDDPSLTVSEQLQAAMSEQERELASSTRGGSKEFVTMLLMTARAP